MRADAARDEAGFEEFVAARSGDLLRTAVLLTRDRGHAEDLLQTALVKAYRRWGRIERRTPIPTSAGSWSPPPRAGDGCGRPRRSSRFPAYDPAGPDPTEGVAERERMAAALATLPPRMRAVLVLRYAEDLSEAATAELLGCSVPTVRSQTVRGLARLRAVLRLPPPVTVLEEC